jgi:hypothetical protein
VPAARGNNGEENVSLLLQPGVLTPVPSLVIGVKTAVTAQITVFVMVGVEV